MTFGCPQKSLKTLRIRCRNWVIVPSHFYYYEGGLVTTPQPQRRREVAGTKRRMTRRERRFEEVEERRSDTRVRTTPLGERPGEPETGNFKRSMGNLYRGENSYQVPKEKKVRKKRIRKEGI